VLSRDIRDPKLLSIPRTGERCGFLLADELGYPQRRSSLRGQVLEQSAVVTRVFLVAQTWTDVENANQLALRDERQSQLHSRSTQRSQSTRIEAQAIQLDDPAITEQVGK
jgi:hypothetical protein